MQQPAQPTQPATVAAPLSAPVRPFVPSVNRVKYGARRRNEYVSTMSPQRLLGTAVSEGFASPWEVEQAVSKSSPIEMANTQQFQQLRTAMMVGDRRYRSGVGTSPGRTMFVQPAGLPWQPGTGRLDPFGGF